MTLLDRILLAVIAALLLVLFGLMVLTTFFGSTLIIDWLQSPLFLLEAIIPALVFLLLGLYLIVLITRADSDKYVVYSKELGAVRISTACVESLMMEAALELKGIKHVRVKISDVENPKASISVQVYPDYNIPELTENLQNNVKDYVENTVGVSFEEIEVVVVDISKKEAELDSSL